MSAFEIVQGDEKDIVVTVTGGVITGANAIKFVLQKGKAAAASDLELTLAGGAINIDSATQFTVSLAEANTVSMKPGLYEVQAQVTDTNNKKKAIVFSPTHVEIKQRLIFS